ncbi:hypothetical protein ABH926_001032 [Catenulispora sp. GP43]|uniref:hypothetical protein n=1 Tax=Catenulispora sp. GP43 TaxID=3156263 RepID=UPI00351679D9
MSENHDAGSPGFEDRIRDLFADGAERNVSAQQVIDGARRRRVRYRAAAAGSSLGVLGVLGVLAVLGVAAGAIAFGGHSAGASQSVFISKRAGSSSPPPAVAAAPAPKTCSASVTGTVPATSPTTQDGLVFETVSGKTAGFPWTVEIHVFPDKQSHISWEQKLQPGTIPQAAIDGEHPGAMAQFRTPGVQGYSEFGFPGGGDNQFFAIQRGLGLGTGTPDKSPEAQGMPKGLSIDDYPAYVTSGWMAPDVDHMCAQYAGHAEFVPVYRIQGGDFYVIGYSAADPPQQLIGYDSAGKVVGNGRAVKEGTFFLMPQSPQSPQSPH